MNTVKKQLISGSIAIASILCIEVLANAFAVAVTPLRDPVLSQGLRSDDSAA